MTSTTLTIDKLCLSPFNVRTYRPDAEDTAALEASIMVDGLLNPIVVHPMRGPKPPRDMKYGAVAGGRRYRAIKALIARGALPADWPVRVTIHESSTDAELTELSISENMIRRDLRDHELYAGVARAETQGHDVATIAAQIGQDDVGTVRRWLRLGKLAPPVFDAFVDGRIAIEVAKAYAATEDAALQAAVFAELSAGHDYQHTAAAVRRAMKVGDREAGRLLLFVGEAIYRAAGGSYELDLFADVEPDRGRITDEPLLRRLVEEKMAGIREEVRATTSRPDLRFVPKPPQTDYGTDDYQLQVTPKRSNSAGADAQPIGLPAGDIVAHVAVDAGGEPAVSFWWESRKAKFGSEKGKGATGVGPVPPAPIREGAALDRYSGDAQRAAAAVRDEAGLTQDEIQVHLSLRKSILRAILIDDARAGPRGKDDLATDYLVWAQLRMLAADPYARAGKPTGMRAIPEPSFVGIGGALDRIQAALGEQASTKIIADALFELKAQTFCTDDDLAAAFLDYRASGRRYKALAAAVVAGLALERSMNADGYRLAIHDTIAAEARAADDASIRMYWTPTESLLAPLPKAALAAIVEPFVDAPTLAAWAKLKATELTRKVFSVVLGVSPSTRVEAREAAETWVHPLLRFDPPPDAGPPPADADAREMETAS